MSYIKLLVSLSIYLLFAGCATHNVTQPPTLDHDLRAQQKQLESKGILLMVNAMHQEDDLKVYFDDDLIKYGILPVQVNITNKHSSQNYLFRPDDIALANAEGDRQQQLTLEQVMDRAKKSYWRSAGWGVAFGVIGAGVSAVNVSNANNKMRATYSARMIKAGNLDRGNIVEGFTFFDVPKDLATLDGWKLDLLMANPSTGDSIALEYPLTGTVLVRKADDDETTSYDDE